MVNSVSIEQFSTLLTHPWQAGEEHLPIIDELIASYPYFGAARMLRLAVLARLNDVRAEAELERTVVYAPSSKTLYNYVNSLPAPTMNVEEVSPAPGSYFDTLQRLERQAEKSHKTLEELAVELAQARQKTVVQTVASAQQQLIENADDIEQYRMAAKNGDVACALERLSVINLHNPKKISYFAERKRYLELVNEIVNKKGNNKK